MHQTISPADLILNPDGSIYHLNLLPEDIADTVITVGDPDRVAGVSKYFDHIELKKGKREFITHTGYLNNKRLTVISTGIGTDNIDIVLNELDALVNIDFATRMVKNQLKSLEIIRIGTAGAIQPDLEMGTILASTHGLGLDALMDYYQSPQSEEHQLSKAVAQHFLNLSHISPYLFSANNELFNKIATHMEKGITATAPGFYAPQGRMVRAHNKHANFLHTLTNFNHQGYRITNLEMETAGIYALANVLGHQAISVSAILASRIRNQFCKNPGEVVEKTIKTVLEKLIMP